MPEDKPITTLDEAAKEYALCQVDQRHLYDSDAEVIINDFKAGSEWQSQQTKQTGLSKDEMEVWNEKGGLSKYEWELEKIVDKIRVTGTLESIGILRSLLSNPPTSDEESGETEETKPVEGLIAIHRVLAILNENYNATKNLTDEDKVRSAQEMVTETYEDLISIFSGKIKNIPANIDSNPMAFYNPVYPKIQTPKPVNNSINFLKWVRDHVTFNDETCKWTDREGDVYTEEELHDLYTLNPTKPVEDNKKH